MIKKNLILFSFFIILFSSVTYAQQDFSPLKPVSTKYKKLLKEAKESQKLLLFITYSDRAPNNSILLLENSSLLSDLNSKMISSVIDLIKDDGHPVLRTVNISSKPFYVFMNEDEIILGVKNSVITEQDLLQFYGQSIRADAQYRKLKEQLDQQETTESYKEMISLLLNAGNHRIAENYIKDWLQKYIPFNDPKEHEFIRQVASACLCSQQLNAGIKTYEKSLLDSWGLKSYLDIRQAYIMKELKNYDLVDPYIIWEVYTEEFGEYADSLYRRFVIDYYQYVKPDKDILLDEIYDFLYYYPATPWDEQKAMFLTAIKYTQAKNDFLLLLDLLEYQIYQAVSFEKLDLKALILYKLDKKERALELMYEVERMQPEYKSLLHQWIDP